MATTLETKNAHPRDAHIRFDEGPHLYFIDGKQVKISVTGFIHSFFPHFDADAVIPRLIKNPKKERYYGRTVQDVKDEWQRIADEASSKGTAMHLAIELYYNGELDDKKHVETALQFYGSKEEALFMDFHKTVIEGSDLEPFRTEWSVYIEEYDLAGQIDGVFRNTKTGELELYDWKRSKKIEKTNRWENGFAPVDHLANSNFWHYSLQLNIYKYILEHKYGYKVSRMFLVFLHPRQDSYIRLQISNFQREVKDMLDASIGKWKPEDRRSTGGTSEDRRSTGGTSEEKSDSLETSPSLETDTKPAMMMGIKGVKSAKMKKPKVDTSRVEDRPKVLSKSVTKRTKYSSSSKPKMAMKGIKGLKK